MKTALTLALSTAAVLLGAQHPAFAESSPNANQIYVPVAQCRLVDTRSSAGGNLVANVAQDFYAYGDAAQISAQGGNAAGCADPKAPNGPEPAAIAVNITAVGNQASANGNLRASAVGVTPTNALVNFQQGTNLSNAAIVPICRGTCTGGKQLSLMSALANVPAVVDVIGYFYPKDTNLVTVARDGGDFTSPLDAIAYLRALVSGSDPDAPSAANPWVIQIDPGTYDLGANPLVLDVAYVTVRGAGGGATILSGEGGGPSDSVVSITKKNVWAENLSLVGNSAAYVIDTDNEDDPASGTAMLADLHVTSDTSGTAFRIVSGKASIVGGEYAAGSGIVAFSVGTARTELSLDGALVSSSQGKAVYLGSAELAARNVTIVGTDYALQLDDYPGQAFGAVAEISHSTLRSISPIAISMLTVEPGAGSEATIDASTIAGNIAYNSDFIRIGASQFTGTASGSSGTLTCVASYNGSFQALGSNCAAGP